MVFRVMLLVAFGLLFVFVVPVFFALSFAWFRSWLAMPPCGVWTAVWIVVCRFVARCCCCCCGGCCFACVVADGSGVGVGCGCGVGVIVVVVAVVVAVDVVARAVAGGGARVGVRGRGSGLGRGGLMIEVLVEGLGRGLGC